LPRARRRSTDQAIERREDARKYPILLTLVAQPAVDQLDEVVTLFDQAVSGRESRAKVNTDAARGKRVTRYGITECGVDRAITVLSEILR
jgi:hypothetical protein